LEVISHRGEAPWQIRSIFHFYFTIEKSQVTKESLSSVERRGRRTMEITKEVTGQLNCMEKQKSEREKVKNSLKHHPQLLLGEKELKMQSQVNPDGPGDKRAILVAEQTHTLHKP
jgi:hypothetical protein